jgi:hypothetical protein
MGRIRGFLFFLTNNYAYFLRRLLFLLLATLMGGTAAVSVAVMGITLALVLAFAAGIVVLLVIVSRLKRKESRTHAETVYSFFPFPTFLQMADVTFCMVRCVLHYDGSDSMSLGN